MKHSKSLLLATAAFVLALSGASYAHDGQGGMGGDGKGWHQGKCERPQFTTAQRELLKSTFEQTRSENKPLREKLHQLRKEEFALIKSDKFDQQAFLNKSAEIEQLRDQMQANRDKAFAAVAPQFSPEERKFLIKMMMRHKHHHGKRGHWEHRGDHKQGPVNAAPQPDAPPAQ